MFVVRRIYTVHPGQARKAATLIDAIGRTLEEAGTRSDSRVYFNSGTTPGDRNTVVMEWTDESLQSTYRTDRVKADGLGEISAKLRELVVESRIEFWELMTEDKRL